MSLPRALTCEATKGARRTGVACAQVCARLPWGEGGPCNRSQTGGLLRTAAAAPVAALLWVAHTLKGTVPLRN